MKKYKVQEIFYSLQGEGANVGSPCCFVRFHGCNLVCTWCDTPQNGEAREMTAQEIVDKAVQEMSSFTQDWRNVPICFTGGEPLMQLDEELLWAFLQNNVRSLFWLETNGTYEMASDLLGYFAHVSCSPKSWPIALQIERVDEFRFPYTKEREDDILTACNEIDGTLLFVSPINEEKEVDKQNVMDAALFCVNNPQFSLSVQMHKIWKVK